MFSCQRAEPAMKVALPYQSAQRQYMYYILQVQTIRSGIACMVIKQRVVRELHIIFTMSCMQLALTVKASRSYLIAIATLFSGDRGSYQHENIYRQSVVDCYPKRKRFLTCMLAPGPGAPIKIQDKSKWLSPGGIKYGSSICLLSSSPMFGSEVLLDNDNLH